MLRFSIITVNLNNSSGLIRTFQSVFGQTYSPIEYIVIDGGSTDGSLEIIKRFENKISYWISETDKGIYHAMNKGIKVATGDIICFLNSGDEYYSNYTLWTVQEYYKYQKPDILFSDFIYNQEANSSELISSDSITNFYELKNKRFGHPSTFYNKQVFEKVGTFDENLSIVSDFEWNIKALKKYSLTFTYLKIPTSIFFGGGTSTSGNDEKMESEIRITVNRYFTPFELKFYNSKIFQTLYKYSRIRIIMEKRRNFGLQKLL